MNQPATAAVAVPLEAQFTADLHESLDYGTLTSDTIESFHRQYPKTNDDPRIGEWLWSFRVYDEFITFRWRGKYWKAEYINGTGPGSDAQFADIGEWVEVQFVPVEVGQAMEERDRKLDPIFNPVITESEDEQGGVWWTMTETEVTGLDESEDGSNKYIEFRIIKPGFGNSRDNHYYPRDVVERDAGVFVGAKMYEVEHKESERNNRTWVSTCVEAGERFDGEGGALGRALVHNSDFWERAVALKEGGQLHQLQNSIVARGSWKPGEAEGRSAKIVTALSEGRYIDWVNRAGAGGNALALFTEAYAKDIHGITTADELADLRPDLVEAVVEAHQARLLSELDTALTQQQLIVSAEQDETPSNHQEDDTMSEDLQAELLQEREAKESAIAELVTTRNTAAEAIIDSAGLPEAVKGRVNEALGSIDLAETDWEDKVNQLIEREQQYYQTVAKAVNGAGKPADLGEADADSDELPDAGEEKVEPALTEAEADERWERIVG